MSSSTTNGKVDDKFLVQYKNDFYDITEFSHKHPGGLNTLKGLNGQNMDERFLKVEHSPAALYLLSGYKLKSGKNGTDLNGNIVTSNGTHMNGSAKKFKEDDSLEHLVDWDKPMVGQIGKLGEQYEDWVNLPVDRPLRLFKQDYLEVLTKTPWYVIPSVWIPVISYLIFTNYMNITTSNKNSILVSRLVFGLIFWTILEYTLHRYVFHLNVKNKSLPFKVFHFLIHGLHHKVPFDPYRLVFPPFPAAVLASIFYQPFRLFDHSQLLLAGGLIGYLCYDMIHYFIHYGKPNGEGYFYTLKRVHNYHHFVAHDKGYGISSSFWDQVFDTPIQLKKLKQILKW